ncbi:MAG TPA: hypothetical protein VGQ02_10780 [Candidatus Limnocylindrales bacterium]|jgi:hypothetical protein|nr:hypothetical protein [Candidatus Limnocylindrales bacterium]
MTDPIGKAIASSDEIVMQEIPVTIASTGRPAIINIPADCTDAELAELCGWMLTQVLAHVRQGHATPASKIVIARAVQ